tara:strand:- start:773 stop:1390 length:618 start_codon:yes stop_codon:yes gene_type:complete
MGTTPILADAGSFAGPYISITGQINGATADGHARNSNDETTTGTIGKVAGSVGGSLGYAIPFGSNFLLDIGASHQPGEARINLDAGEGDALSDNAGDVNIEFKDFLVAYIKPTIAVSDSAAFYAKHGYAHTTMELSGDTKDGKGALHGDLWAVGSKALFGNGLFIETEAGVIIYDDIQFERLNATGSGRADPEVAYGSMSIGFKF